MKYFVTLLVLSGLAHISFAPDLPYCDRKMWYYFAEHLLNDYRTNVELLDF